ncbi:unnamed protein product [Echinostoma caproni]|uniref:Vacuolar protein sorting-associated protein 52 homolog n=1 Tax=Echinostoma caproni TaxID=27848 RepID=A0A183ASL6_9TREM|nr:unnamed protein product [Echinostoma caproni]
MTRVSSVRAKPACCPICIRVRTLDVANLNGHRGRRRTSAGGGFGEIWTAVEVGHERTAAESPPEALLFYNEFLLAHDREIATEVRNEYVNTMSKVYYSYFKAYCSKLTKLQLDTTSEKEVLLAKRLDDQGSTSTTSSVMGAMGLSMSASQAIAPGNGGLATSTGSRLGLFGLGDRAVRVLGQSNLESAIILPHVAAKAEVKKHMETQLIPSAVHDVLGLLICLQLLYAMLRRAKERSVPVLYKFWTDLTESLWVRVSDRLDAHIASLQNDFDISTFVNGMRGLTTGTGLTSGGGSLPARAYALIRPHPIARRYAELAASLHSIGHAFPGILASLGGHYLLRHLILELQWHVHVIWFDDRVS